MWMEGIVRGPLSPGSSGVGQKELGQLSSKAPLRWRQEGSRGGEQEQDHNN